MLALSCWSTRPFFGLWRRQYRPALVCALALLVWGCSEATPTQTIVRLAATPELRSQAEALSISIWDEEGETIVERTDPVSDGAGDLARVPVIPRGGDPARTFEIRAELLNGDGASLGFERAVVGFRPRELGEVLLVFDSSCENLDDCGTGRRCVLGQCVGGCVETAAESPERETLATCGTCERCSAGRCEPLDDDTACGCEGDSCQNGDCVVARPVREVSSGAGHTCARLEEGVYCWGANEHGQVGVVGDEIVVTPTRPVELDTFSRRVQTAAIATCVLGGDGTRHCFGENTLGQLGNGETGPGGPEVISSDIPPWRELTAGGSHFCGFTADGQTHCFGYNVHGQLGTGDANRSQNEPVRAPALDDPVVLEAGGLHTCHISTDGVLACVGFNDSGQLGTGDTATRLEPIRPGCEGSTDSLCVDDWRQVSAGSFHSCGLREGGTLYCWGGNTNAQVGIGVVGTDELTPKLVDSERSWATVSAGFQHTCALDADGAAHCWGAGSAGQLGSGRLERQTRPGPVVAPEIDTRWVDIGTSIAGAHTCAIDSNGGLWCWGSNEKGQMAHTVEELEHAPTPRRVCL